VRENDFTSYFRHAICVPPAPPAPPAPSTPHPAPPPPEQYRNCLLQSAIKSMNVKGILRILLRYFQNLKVSCFPKCLTFKILTIKFDVLFTVYHYVSQQRNQLNTLSLSHSFYCVVILYINVSQTVVRGPQVILGFCPCGPLRLNVNPKKTENTNINIKLRKS
jgi:hypothetical protein